MNFTDFLRQAMAVKGNKQVIISKLDDGRYQASMLQRDDSFRVETHADPVDALWNCMVPHTMRRPPPSSLTAGPVPWYITAQGKKIADSLADDLLADEPVKTASSDLDDLLGPAIKSAMSKDVLDDLLG